MTDAILLDPDPPTRGNNCRITYDGPVPVTLRYRIDNETWVEFTIDSDHPFKDVPIPSGAGWLRVEDLTGDAPYRLVPCAA